MNWYKSNPIEAGQLVAKNIDFFKAEAISDSIVNVQLESKTAIESKKDLYDFFEVLKEIEPKLIGSKIPDDNFIWE